MTYHYDSIAECQSAPSIAQLGGKRSTNFAPLLSRHYFDAEGIDMEACPDFLIQRPRCFTFIDTKSGKLNGHYTRSSSREALAEAYEVRYRRPATGMSHSALSEAHYNADIRGTLTVMDHGWNHSVWKQAAVQAKHGWQRFLVVFKKSPSKREAVRYLDAGLVFCTVKTLPELMRTIELTQYGFFVPFVFTGPGYSFSVTPDHTSEASEATNRAQFEAAVATTRAAAAAKQAQDDIDWEAGLRPF